MSLETVKNLKPVKYKYNEILKIDDDKVHMGFLAQDLQKLFGKDHAVVIQNKDNGFLMVNYHELIAPLTKAIQDLSNKVEILESKLKEQGD